MPYLFGTSAARSVGRARLESARSKGIELLLSPITFWELACHLDEEPFGRPRGNVLKGCLFTVLHDPLAELAVDVGCPGASNRTRFEDREAVLAVLGELQQASSYADLANRSVTVRGERRTIGDIANNTQKVFDKERDQFVAALRAQGDSYVRKYTRQGTIALGGVEFTALATRLARGLLSDMAAAGCNVELQSLVDRTVLGCGYCVGRVCNYVASVPKDQNLPIDGNDLDDYFICLHLGVSSGRTLVTNDERTRTAIQRTLAEFRAQEAFTGVTIPPTASVLTADEFVAIAEAV